MPPEPQLEYAATGSTSWNSTIASAVRVARPAHVFFAVTMMALGILGLIKGDFTPTWSGVPQSVAARHVLAYLCALLSLVCGIGLLWKRTAVVASRVLLTYLVVWWLFFRIPYVVLAPTSSGAWWACGDSAAMVAAAWVLYAWFAHDLSVQRPGFATGEKGMRIARVLYGLGLIPFGIAHFTFLERTVSLVPGWLPWHTAWAYFTGAAFILAGVGVATGVFARLAAALSTLQMAGFILLVWVPIVVGHPSASDWAELVGSWSLTAAGWVVAESYRGMPWLAGRRR